LNEFTDKEGVGVEEALAVVDRMSAANQKALYDALALRFQGQKPADRELEAWASSVYTAAQEALGVGGGGMAGPLVFRRLLGAPTAWAPVESFMRGSGLAELLVAERLAVMRLLAKLLVARCQKLARHSGIPLGPKLIANNTADLAAIVDQELPGYGRSKMLLYVAQHMFREGRHE
jgi:hypothetical protein